MQPKSRPSESAPSAHERVYKAIRQSVMHGAARPGQPLTLRGIGQRYDVSMTPAREAVRRLAAEGALNVSASGRVTVTELSNERIEELAAIRAMLEPELACRALPRAHNALIDRLQLINGQMAEVIAKGDAVGYIRTNLEFHRTLYLRAHAPAMLAMAETVWLQLGPTMRALYGRMQRTELPRHHRSIVACLRSGDEAGLRLTVRADVTQGLSMLVS